MAVEHGLIILVETERANQMSRLSVLEGNAEGSHAKGKEHCMWVNIKKCAGTPARVHHTEVVGTPARVHHTVAGTACSLPSLWRFQLIKMNDRQSRENPATHTILADKHTMAPPL